MQKLIALILLAAAGCGGQLGTDDGAADEAALAGASGGTWNGSCDCGGGWPMAFSRGAGGCWMSPAAGESECDATNGLYSDDETNLAGTFCDCGYARHLTASGCVANRF